MAYTRVEWDPSKDRANRRRHRLGFADVQALFEADHDHLVLFDEMHSDDEDRFLAIGRVRAGVVTVAFAEPRDGVARVISARRATPTEAAALVRYLGGRRP